MPCPHPRQALLLDVCVIIEIMHGGITYVLAKVRMMLARLEFHMMNSFYISI